jgi:hypothetical protein
MGTPLPDPERADSVGGFIRELRLLKTWAGEPSLRRLSHDCGLARSTLGDLLSPRRSRLPSLDLVLAYVEACGVTGERVAAWRAAWRNVHARAVAVPVGRSAEAVVPRQLPARTRRFVGRDRQLHALDRQAEAGEHTAGPSRVAVVTGMPGIGKTALAVAWAYRAAHRFPDGQLYINLRGVDPTRPMAAPTAVLRGFLEALAVRPERIPPDLDVQAALYRSLLAVRRVLVVLDDADSVEQVRPLLPGSSTCFAVVTSRTRLTGLVVAEGAHPIPLDLLAPADALRLLSVHVGTRRLAAEPDAVRSLVERCGGLPLALTSVAARAARHPELPLGALAAELAIDSDRLDALETDDRATNLRTAFSLSYRRLATEAQLLFRLLGTHPGPDITVPLAARLAEVPVARARTLLRDLARAHMVIERGHGRYHVHPLLRGGTWVD